MSHHCSGFLHTQAGNLPFRDVILAAEDRASRLRTTWRIPGPLAQSLKQSYNASQARRLALRDWLCVILPIVMMTTTGSADASARMHQWRVGARAVRCGDGNTK